LLEPPLENLLADKSLTFPMMPFPYQLQGVAFLYPRLHAVLADEMGLGKTMQTVTAIRLLLHEGRIERVLLVCPKPLLTNWQREFQLWAPELSVTLIEGDPATRHWLWQRERPGVMLANYELTVRDRPILPRRRVPFDLVVLDESQRIKNRHSATSQAVRMIARKRSWALTGTPLENHTDDLVGIFEFLLPGYLRSDMRPRRLGRAISDYVLRRTKDQVLNQLPPVMRRDAMLHLDPEQRRTYELAEKEGIVRLSRMGHSLTVRHVLELILRLKQICNFDPATGSSAKLERLLADLQECRASGRKVIVFSQWVETLRRLNQSLKSFQPLEYHGRIPANQRDSVIDRFRRDARHQVLLISYGAGGVGLNLQFTGYVFLFDRWWNPAVEDQAIHRAHRIGTESPVIVTRLMAVDTIEERIADILDKKRQLFQAVFSATRPAPRWGLSAAELLQALGLQPPAGWSAQAA
jgi:SNF2 family DNA or RNA helicase